MHRRTLGVALLAVIATACASSSSTSAAGSSTSASTAAECATGASLVEADMLVVGTDNPAYSPYFQGGAEKDSEWKINDPNTGEGFESAVAYEIAGRMGFTNDQVGWIALPFDQSYAPGPKDFDMYLAQVSYKPARANSVDFSTGYYDVNQALVATKGSPITEATSIAELKSFNIAAPLGTTSYDTITDVIVPDTEPGVYNTLDDTVAALNAGAVDGIIVDYPTAVYLADPYVQEVKDGVVVGQFPAATDGTAEYFGTVQAKDSSLTPCIDLALAEMEADGALADIQREWLSDNTNVGTVPEFTS